MVGKYLRRYRCGSICQNNFCHLVCSCCFASYLLPAWFFISCIIWRNDIDFERRRHEHTRSAQFFAGRQTAKILATCHVYQSRFLFTSGSFHRIITITNQLLLLPSSPVFAYYSGLILRHRYGHLNNDIASSKNAVFTLISFQHTASTGLRGTFQSDLLLEPEGFLLDGFISVLDWSDRDHRCLLYCPWIQLCHGHLVYGL